MFLADGFFSFVDNLTLLPALLLMFGTVLFSIEMFIPGFGFFGLFGIVCYVAAILFTAKDFMQFVSMVILLMALLAVMTTIMLILIGKGKIPNKMVLKDSIQAVSTEVSKDSHDMDVLVGMKGVSVSTLRPSGIVEIDGVRLDVMTNGEFIEIDTPIEVLKIVEGHIIVREYK